MIGTDALVHALKQIARDEVGPIIASTWGYVAAYDADNNLIQAVLPTFREMGQVGLQPAVTDWIQLGTPTTLGQFTPQAVNATPANPTGGDQVLITIMSSQTGISVAACCFNNNSFPCGGNAAQGEHYLASLGGKSIKWGQDQIIINAGSTPVAIEGSQVTHHHTLDTFLTAFAAACTAAGSSPLTGTDLGSIITALMSPPGVADITDTAGNAGTTPSAVDVGQGAQDFFAPSAGGS